ncbi:cell wall-binding repeat-containing protein, partial [Clostridium sp.]
QMVSGNRIKNLKFNGQLVKESDVFTVAINNYRYNGGGGFMAAAGIRNTNASLVTYDSAKVLGDDGQVRSLMMKYVEDNKSITPSSTNNWKISTMTVTPNYEASKISIIGTSDVHGSIFPLDYNTGLAANVGLARVSTYVNSVRATNANTMLIDNGDTIQGTPLSYYYDMIDKTTEYPMMKVMGAMGYDTWTLGNHEFNYGLDTLNRIIGDATKENISVLSANTYNTDETNFVKPYIIKSLVVNGKTIKVGILGLTTKTIPNWEDPTHYAGLHFNDLVDEAQKWVPLMKTAGADVVIASIHSGIKGASDTIPENQVDAVAQQVSGIDAILCGHTHTGKTYSYTNPDGKVVPVVEPKNGDGIISQIDLNIDADGNFTGVNAFNVTLSADTVPDPAILAIAQPYQDATLAYTNTVIGQSTAIFEGTKQLTQPSTIMELVNKVQAAGAGTTLSIAAPLSLTAKVPQGDVKRQDIMGVYVYENFLFGINMTGSQLKNWLEWSVRYYKQTTSSTDTIVKDPVLNIADYNLDQLYGATYDIDLSQAACTVDSTGKVISGNRIKNLKVNGVLVKDTDALKVAVNNYRYNGGGGFMAAAGFVPGSPATIAATFYDSAKTLGDDGQVRNMMFKYVQDNKTISPTNSNNWKISTTVVAPGNGGGSTSSGGGGGSSTPVVTTVQVSVVTKTDSNLNVVATLDASKINKNAINVIRIDEPKPESKIQVQIPASAIGTGTGSFMINTKAASLSIPTSIIDASLLSSGGTLRVSQNIMPTADANAMLVNIPSGDKTNGKVFSFEMAVYDSNNNLVSAIHNFASGKSVAVTINLNNDDIKGMDTSKIAAFYFDVASKKWVEIGGSFDSVKMTFTFNTTHFTDFTIMQKAEVNVNRLSGANRIETSIAIAKEQYTVTKPEAIVLATANGFADALAGSGLAYKYNAPLLLTNKTVSNSKSVLEYITTSLSKTKNIYILGGTGVVSSEIEDYLTLQGYKIIRLGGENRYETNQKIVDYLNITKGTSMVIATGNDFADALSISSIADIKGLPVLLNSKDSLSASVRSYITNLQPTTIYIIGGTGVLSSNIETQIKNLNGKITIVRLGGVNRYETSMNIMEYFNLTTTTVTVATGVDFPDALSGSVLAARKNCSVLLVDNKDITKQKDLLNKQKITNVIVFGGEGVISKDIATSLIQK